MRDPREFGKIIGVIDPVVLSPSGVFPVLSRSMHQADQRGQADCHPDATPTFSFHPDFVREKFKKGYSVDVTSTLNVAPVLSHPSPYNSLSLCIFHLIPSINITTIRDGTARSSNTNVSQPVGSNGHFLVWLVSMSPRDQFANIYIPKCW